MKGWRVLACGWGSACFLHIYDESQPAGAYSCSSACCRREQATAEKASIDEIYLDVTGMVEAELRASAPLGGGPAPSATAGFGWGGVVIDGPLRVDNEFERRLSVGAMIACRLRGAVREQLGAPGHPLPFPPPPSPRAAPGANNQCGRGLCWGSLESLPLLPIPDCFPPHLF